MILEINEWYSFVDFIIFESILLRKKILGEASGVKNNLFKIKIDLEVLKV